MSPIPWRETPVRTLLVDLDGTLLESHDLGLRTEFITRTLWRLSREAGLRRALRALRATTSAVERLPQGEAAALTNAERGARAFAAEMGLSIEEGERLMRDVVGGIFPTLERHFYPVPGARRFIDWAGARFRLVLATNPVWPLELVKLRLQWAGIDPGVFASITHSGRMHACKPSVEYYEELLAQEGLDARDCALVGDDFRKDLPAVKAGISVFILAGSESSSQLAMAGARARAAAGSYERLMSLLEGSA